MFAKLKQKIAEEESTCDSSRPVSSSPSVRRAKVNGWTENKWERRRLSNASSLYESRESLFSERSACSSSGYNVSRHASFTSRSSATPAGTPMDPPNYAINSRASREEVLNLLAKKGEQVNRLEAKIADMASLLTEQSRVRDSLESTIERQREEHATRIQGINMEFEERCIKLKSDHEKELGEKLKALSLEGSRNADMNELNQLQQQELNKMKSLFIQYQTDATRKAAEIIEKSKQIESLDNAYIEQKGELATLQERLDDLARERTKYELRDKQQYRRMTSLENEKSSLREELNSTVSELTQKSLQLNRVEKSLSLTEEELSNVRQAHALYKNKVSAELEEKSGEISQLKERVSDLEQRLEDSKLSGNDHVKAMEKERDQLETRLREARDQLNQLKTSSNDRINTLGSLVSTLNERFERKEAELAETQRKHEQEIETWKSQLVRLQDDRISGKRTSEEQTANLEEQVIRLEAARERERTEVQEKLEQFKTIENEYCKQEDEYKQQLADLEEEKEQLQNELMLKAEENRHVSLCLEDAMRETNELKSQIAKFEEALKEKDDLLTCFKESKLDSPSHLTCNLDPEAVENLREELHNTTLRYQTAEEVLKEREHTIAELRRTVMEKEELLNRSSTKLRQYEENNRYLRNDKIYSPERRENQKAVASLKEKVKELEEQLQEREMLQLDENELRDLRKDNYRLEKDLEDRDKKIKLLQAKIVELKKAFQRELKMPAPGGESELRSPCTPNGDVSSQSEEDKDRLEYLDMNFKYLKHVILKYMCSTNKQSRQLINVIGHLLRFSPKEEACVKEAMEWKLPLE